MSVFVTRARKAPIEQRERLEAAKLEALREAGSLGWADIAAGRYADVADDQLEDFISQLGLRGKRGR